jgi:multidrug efflux pump subunit AcrA (membrane-fusion protein)
MSMTDPFSAWIDFQEQMLELQRAQLEAAKRAIEGGADMTAAKRAAENAAQLNIKAWQSWLDLWKPKP